MARTDSPLRNVDTRGVEQIFGHGRWHILFETVRITARENRAIFGPPEACGRVRRNAHLPWTRPVAKERLNREPRHEYDVQRSVVWRGEPILALAPRARSFRRSARSRRGISDVIGTILLLGLTVTLFGTIFVFVSTFPRPPPQPTGQFSASMQVSYSGTVGTIQSISIAHLAGPTIQSTISNQIWISSAAKPSAFTGPFTIQQGLATGTSWAIGQTWTLNLTTYNLHTPDNLTISIVSANQLLFHQTVPGSSPSIPPQFTNQGTVPTNPTVGTKFKVFVQISDQNLNPVSSPNAVMINYSLLPGFVGTSATAMTYSATNGSWEFYVPAGTLLTGTYYVFVSATDSLGLHNTIAVPVTLVAPPPQLPGPVSVTLALNQTSPVNGTASSLIATVVDEGASGGAVTVKFFVNGALIGTAGGLVVAGGSVSISQSWTPTKVGTAVIIAQGNVNGVGVSNGTLTLTIFPNILVIGKNLPFASTKTFGPADESGWLRAALVSAGVPFRTTDLSCSSSLPTSTSSTYNKATVLILDFGSSTASTCPTISASDQATVASLAVNRSVLVFGADLWSTSAGGCPSAAFLSAFGLVGSASACAASLALPAANAAVFTANAGVGLLGAGVPATWSVNKTIAGNATFQAMSLAGALQSGFTATTFLTVSTKQVGEFVKGAGGIVKAIVGLDPSMLAQTLPAPGSQTFGTGAAGTELVYNLVDFVTGITPNGATNSNRQGTDFAVSEMQLLGLKHTAPTSVLAGVRSNGLVGGVVTVTLLVNGTPALYGGQVVSQVLYVNGGGAAVFVSLSWQASGGGPYALAVQVIAASDANSLNNVFAGSILPIPYTFS